MFGEASGPRLGKSEKASRRRWPLSWSSQDAQSCIGREIADQLPRFSEKTENVNYSIECEERSNQVNVTVDIFLRFG